MKMLVMGLAAIGVLLVSASTTKPNTARLTSQEVQIISGRASVSDGDTLRIGAVRIRLHGLDAVEGRQTCKYKGEPWACGRASRKALERVVKGETVVCEVRDVDRYERYVAVCRVNGEDINAAMVRDGWAVAYTRYSNDYVSAEADARAARRGIWRATFERPEHYRARLRNMSATPGDPSVRGCSIKGNISRGSGARIYHMPGQADYARTKISLKNDERWFCSEEEAQDAGWRRAAR